MFVSYGYYIKTIQLIFTCSITGFGCLNSIKVKRTSCVGTTYYTYTWECVYPLPAINQLTSPPSYLATATLPRVINQSPVGRGWQTAPTLPQLYTYFKSVFHKIVVVPTTTNALWVGRVSTTLAKPLVVHSCTAQQPQYESYALQSYFRLFIFSKGEAVLDTRVEGEIK